VLKAPTHQGHHAPKLRQAQGVVELWPWPGRCKKNGLERGKHPGKKRRNADLIVNLIGYGYVYLDMGFAMISFISPQINTRKTCGKPCWLPKGKMI
jgi:hypothetical protein